MLQRVSDKHASHIVKSVGFNSKSSCPYSCNPNTDNLLGVQSKYIDNLQQQIYYLESEINYLRSHVDDSEKCRPNMLTEMEKMVEKLLESERKTKNLEDEIENHEYKVTISNNEKNKLKKDIEAIEENYKREKTVYVEEMVELRKKNKQLEDEINELLDKMKNLKKKENVAILQIVRKDTKIKKLVDQLTSTTELVENLQKNIQKQETKIYNGKINKEEVLVVDNNKDVIVELKKELEELYTKLKQTEQELENEKLLKRKLSEDKDLFIDAEAKLKSQLIELRSKLEVEEQKQAKMEQLYNHLVAELSEMKSCNIKQKLELEQLNKSIETKKADEQQLEFELSEEKLKNSEQEEIIKELESKLNVESVKMRKCLEANCNFQKDSILLNDKIVFLNEKITSKETENKKMKQQIIEMKKSVDLIIKQNETTLQIQDCRWRHLMQLAQGIQQLSKDAIKNS